MNYTPLPEGLASFNEPTVKGAGASHNLFTIFKGVTIVVLTVAAGLSTATLIRNAVTLQNKATELNQTQICVEQGGVVWDGQQCPDGAQEVNKIVSQTNTASPEGQSSPQQGDGPSSLIGSGEPGSEVPSTSVGNVSSTKVQLCCKLPPARPIPTEETVPVEPSKIPTPQKSVDPAPTEAERCELPGITTILSCPEGCNATF